jgi:hypothetical protein
VRIWLAILIAVIAGPAFGQLNEHCTVSVLNRTAQVQRDGRWVINNIPANQGPVRARVLCVENGVLRTGSSNWFVVPVDGTIGITDITFDSPPPIPATLALTAPRPVMREVGESMQLSAVVTYPGGTTRPVPSFADGTVYTTSNPRIVTVSTGGRVTAAGMGTVLISAMNEGSLGLVRITVSNNPVDSDGDGMPDDWEITYGFNPNDPGDAAGDADADGLTNLREFQLDTDPTIRDTDGDGVSDGLEVQVGSNPLDPNSINLAASLQSIRVDPSSVEIVNNTFLGEGFRIVRVLGLLRDGDTLDVTSRGTAFETSNPSVLLFSSQPGQLIGGAPGSATLTVRNNGFTATAPVTVRSFAPQQTGFLASTGLEGLAVRGNYCFLAAGAGGLRVADITDRRAPRLVATYAAAGTVRDVAVDSQGRAYLALAGAGLEIVDVSVPTQPVRLALIDTPGTAVDVSLFSLPAQRLAYVADSTALVTFDVTIPTLPVLVSTLALPGAVAGFDRNDTIGVVALSHGGVAVIDAVDPAAPRVLASLPTPGQGARGVRLVGTAAVVADSIGSTLTIDLTDPARPSVGGATAVNTGGILVDLGVHGGFAFGADTFFFNALPIADVADPAAPFVRGRIDYTNPSQSDQGSGVEADSRFVYRTGFRGLYIAQYVDVPAGDLTPPAVTITSPANGSSVLEGQRVRIALDARDDTGVSFASIFAGNAEIARDSAPPFEMFVRVPAGSSTLTVRAFAHDHSGNQSAAAQAVLNVTRDLQPPAVTIAEPADGLSVSEGMSFRIRASATDNAAVSRLELLSNGAVIASTGSGSITFDYTAPVDVTQLLITARAFDYAGNSAVTPARRVTVLPDAAPVINMIAPVAGQPLLPEGEVYAIAHITDDIAVGATRVIVNGISNWLGHWQHSPPNVQEGSVRLPAGTTSATVTIEAADGIGQVTTTPPLVLPVSPTSALGSAPINGFGNDVEVDGNYAFVAAGAAGLEVFDVSNPAAPVRVAGLDTPGLASSLETAGGLIYLADGTAGLAIIDATNPLAPQSVSTLAMPAEVSEILLDGGRVYVGGTQGVHAVDVRSAAEPLLLGTHYVYGPVMGMTRVNGVLAVLTDVPRARLQDIYKSLVVEVVDLASFPTLLHRQVIRVERTHTGFGLASKGSMLYITNNYGIYTLDLTNPANPGTDLRGNLRIEGLNLRDVTAVGDRLIASRHGNRNAASIFAADPGFAVPLIGIVDFTALGTHRGTAATGTPELLYTTAATSLIDTKTATGTTRLFVGRYFTFNDTAGVKPVVSLIAPSSGTSAVAGESVSIQATATDDVAVARVEFSIDGVLLSSDSTPPYRATRIVPAGGTSFTISAVAFDYAGNASTPATVTVGAGADTAAPTVSLTSPRRGHSLPGNTMVMRADARDNFRVAEVRFTVNGAIVHTDTQPPYDFTYAVPAGSLSVRAGAVAVDRAGNTGQAQEITVPVVTPRVLGSVAVPGYANAVDTNGRYAYVAAGSAGMHVFDLIDPANPVRIATLDTPGICSDVAVTGNYAFVGDADTASPSGSHIVDIRNPAAPVLVSTVTFMAGNYIGAVQRGFVAAHGSRIMSFSAHRPASPIGTSFASDAFPRGAGAEGTNRYWSQLWSSTNGLLFFSDLGPDPIPRVGKNSVLFDGGDPMGVVARHNLAAVATNAGLATVDTRIRNEYRSGAANGPALREIDIYGGWVFGARRDAVNSTAIFDVGEPLAPVFAGSIDLTSAFPTYQQTNLVVTPTRLLITAVEGGTARPGVTGTSRLIIVEPFVIEDTAGVAPSVSLQLPSPVRAGELFLLTANASDDVAVASVTFYVNSVAVFEDTVAPYEYNHMPLTGATQVTVQARAKDFAGNVGQTVTSTLTVVP